MKRWRYLFAVLALGVVLSGCASAGRDGRTVGDGIHHSVMQADRWVKENLW